MLGCTRSRCQFPSLMAVPSTVLWQSSRLLCRGAVTSLLVVIMQSQWLSIPGCCKIWLVLTSVLLPADVLHNAHASFITIGKKSGIIHDLIRSARLSVIGLYHFGVYSDRQVYIYVVLGEKVAILQSGDKYLAQELRYWWSYRINKTTAYKCPEGMDPVWLPSFII